MTDNAKQIAEMIEKAMEGVTPGPWSVDGYSTDAVIYMPEGKDHVSDWKHLAKCGNAEGHWRHNAAYIALCQPANLRILLSALSEAEKERDANIVASSAFNSEIIRREKAEAELAQARKALEGVDRLWKNGVLFTPNDEIDRIKSAVRALLTDTGRTEGEKA